LNLPSCSHRLLSVWQGAGDKGFKAEDQRHNVLSSLFISWPATACPPLVYGPQLRPPANSTRRITDAPSMRTCPFTRPPARVLVERQVEPGVDPGLAALRRSGSSGIRGAAESHDGNDWSRSRLLGSLARALLCGLRQPAQACKALCTYCPEAALSPFSVAPGYSPWSKPASFHCSRHCGPPAWHARGSGAAGMRCSARLWWAERRAGGPVVANVQCSAWLAGFKQKLWD